MSDALSLEFLQRDCCWTCARQHGHDSAARLPALIDPWIYNDYVNLTPRRPAKLGAGSLLERQTEKGFQPESERLHFSTIDRKRLDWWIDRDIRPMCWVYLIFFSWSERLLLVQDGHFISWQFQEHFRSSGKIISLISWSGALKPSYKPADWSEGGSIGRLWTENELFITKIKVRGTTKR